MKPQQRSHHMFDMCKNHMHHYVLLETTDGTTVDGIITDVDEMNVYLAIPNMESDMAYEQRFSPYGYGGGYGGGYGYGSYPPYGPRPPYGPYQPYYPGGRFRRLILPLTALTALSVLPWF
ncbi:hypothetical protein Pryu01_01689 [Paraliobacillus ryukyuensis]|uniref:Uncharacterized protein n=1 Tax=Paraliobacillus ryukyuensis TaxID=200904 RepID=A0A366E7Z3_9BACI|nr:hypothetical protein [Paraliobacillus ryukyuensis]RBO98205.1 hypothetical protein DES48_10555 [Paraliobacillus ryukyuensis]